MNFGRSASFRRAYNLVIRTATSSLGYPANRIQQIIVFAMLGICVNLIYGALFLTIVWAVPEQRVGASTVAYVTACLFQYVANAKLTFGREVWNVGQALRYGLAVLIGYVVSTLFLTWIVPPLGIPDIVALLIVAVSLPILNFITFSVWVYRSRRDDRRPTSA